MAPSLSRDRSLQLAIACALVLLGIIVVLMSGCAYPHVTCPPGTFQRRATETTTATGGANLEVTIPTQGGKGSGTWSAGGSAVYECARICPAGTVIDYQRAAGGAERVRCAALPRPADEAPASPPLKKETP